MIIGTSHNGRRLPLLALADVGIGEVALCGGKAARLGELVRRGHLVPPAVVASAAVFETFISDNGLGSFVERLRREHRTAGPARLLEIEQDTITAFGRATLRGDVMRALTEWMSGRRHALFAVRSSGIDEDGVAASFAGQYSSWLDVDEASVVDVLKRCFASRFTARGALYRRRLGLSQEPAMAVMLQEMVRGDHGGVVFTQAPRRFGSLLIECAPGGCDGVVSGEPPSRFYVDRATRVVDATENRHQIDTETVSLVAKEALTIEAELGGPHDVEYTVRGRTVYALQARPISVQAHVA